MLPLIKIRATYLKRKKSTCIFSYLLIPSIITFSLIIYILNKGHNEPVEMAGKTIFPDESPDYYLFKNSSINNYSELYPYLENTSLVVNNAYIREKLHNFILEKTNISLKTYSSESKLNNHSQNIIVLKYNEKKKTYKFTYKEKEIVDLFYEKKFPFDTSLLSTQNASDVFIYDYDSYGIAMEQNIMFLRYQAFLASFLIELENKTINKDIHFDFGLNSYPPSVDRTTDDNNYDLLEPLICYIIGMQFSFIFLSFSIQMLEEKDLKLEKLLERQGIGVIKYISSWFINYLFVGLMANIACILGSTQVLVKLSGLFYIDLIFYNLAQFSLLYFIVNISTNKKSGIILVNLLCFGSLVVGLVLNQGGGSHRLTLLFFNLFPNTNIFTSIKCIIKLQRLGRFSWDNIRLRYNKICYLDTFIMFIVEILLYSFISLFYKYYKNSGLPFLDYVKSFFIKVNREIDENNLITNKDSELSLERHHEELNEANKTLKSQNMYLDIRGVTKKYDDLVAVNNFSGELYKNEIFCLLGHNGAGKTTLIKMISGSEDPNMGDIFLNNISVITNKNYLYHNIGLCQQEDIFFDYLTVAEHLKYMMEIKGGKGNKEEINTLINKINLQEKKDAICKNLSGGEKRKLCIALALVGNSQLVLLDEPTSGMDVMAKRALWDFLKEYKNDKIIILTTHSLDEAEYLGDRIGIMSNGDFICSGTSSFLKSKYPCGFNLNLLTDSSKFNEDKKQQIYNQLLQYEPNLEIKISSKGLFSLNIQSNNHNIKEIFNIIETNKEEYGIEDYTVSSTTLEDVFLKLNHKITINDENENNEALEINMNDSFNINNPVPFLPQLKYNIKRGIFSLWRNKGYSFLELLIGLFTLYIYVFVYYTALGNESQQILSLTDLLEVNDIFICKNNKKFFKDSYLNDKICSVKLKTVGNTDIKEDFIEEIYQKALGNIGKSGICVTNLDSDDNDYEVYNTEIPMSIPGYIMANSMLTVSAFLKKEYGIKAAIFDEIINIRTNDFGMSALEMSVMFTLCFGCAISFGIYLSTIIAEKIKERAKNIKHILYLSGANMWSYWCGFYVVDFVKMMIFCSLAASSIYLINDYASYIWINLIFCSFSSLLFIYSISFLFEKEESGQKAMSFLLFLVLVAFLIFVAITTALDMDVDYSFLLNDYNYTIFDLSPLSSFMLSSIRLTFSYIIFKAIGNFPFDEFDFGSFGKLHRPKNYFLTSLMANFINCILYLGLLFLLESGYIKQLFNYIKVKFLIKESNITFSNEQMSEEFTSINNIETPNVPLLNSNEGENNNNLTEQNTNKISECVQNEINKINNDTENRLTTKIIALKKNILVML